MEVGNFFFQLLKLGYEKLPHNTTASHISLMTPSISRVDAENIVRHWRIKSPLHFAFLAFLMMLWSHDLVMSSLFAKLNIINVLIIIHLNWITTKIDTHGILEQGGNLLYFVYGYYPCRYQFNANNCSKGTTNQTSL